MFKYPIIGIVFWFCLGISGGWWMHSLYTHQEPATASIDPAPAQVAPASLETQPPSSYKKSLDHYRQSRQTRAKNTEQQRAQILDQAERLLNEDDDLAYRLLDDFLDIDSYDPRAMLLKAQAAFLHGNYAEALDIALELRNLPQTEISGKTIVALLDNITSTYAAELNQLDQLDELLYLYRRMTQAIPEKRGYYYKLAEVQYRLNHYYDAIASLNYSLYDPVWGERSRQLLQKAQQYINLVDGEQVALENIGGHFFVNAQINYIDGVKLLVDTGASLSSLRPEAAERLGIIYGDSESIVNVAGGAFSAPLVTIESLALGDVEINNIRINVIELGSGIEADGLLGMNFMRRFRFFIDQERELLFLGDK